MRGAPSKGVSGQFLRLNRERLDTASDRTGRQLLRRDAETAMPSAASEITTAAPVAT